MGNDLYGTVGLPTDAEERKAIPVYTGFMAYFPDAIAAVARLSLVGGLQHGHSIGTVASQVMSSMPCTGTSSMVTGSRLPGEPWPIYRNK